MKDRGEVSDLPRTVNVVPAPNTPHSDTGPCKNLPLHGRGSLGSHGDVRMEVMGRRCPDGRSRMEGDGMEVPQWTQWDGGDRLDTMGRR